MTQKGIFETLIDIQTLTNESDVLNRKEMETQSNL
jgi:hypothetical protein